MRELSSRSVFRTLACKAEEVPECDGVRLGAQASKHSRGVGQLVQWRGKQGRCQAEAHVHGADVQSPRTARVSLR